MVFSFVKRNRNVELKSRMRVFKQNIFNACASNGLMKLSLIEQKAVTGMVVASDVHITSYSNNCICYVDTVSHQAMPVTYLWPQDPLA